MNDVVENRNVAFMLLLRYFYTPLTAIVIPFAR